MKEVTNMTTKIYTEIWEPYHGCLQDCPGCQAATLLRRLGGHRDLAYYMCQEDDPETGKLHILEKPMRDEVTGVAEDYPFAFDPTFSRYRLADLFSIPRPSNVFVCGKGDLFAPWVPDQIIAEILDAARKTPAHNYLFLTRFPERYAALPYALPNFLFGAYIDSQQQLRDMMGVSMPRLRYLSIDPLKERIDLQEYLNHPSCKLEWIVLETRTTFTHKDAGPQKRWMLDLIRVCAKHGIPLFMEDRLKMITEGILVQQLHPMLQQIHDAQIY